MNNERRIVQTVRHRESGGDWTFVEYIGGDNEAFRLMLPPEVTATIARQRDALTSKNRSKAAKATAEDRKARGIAPGFMRKKGAKK